MNIPVFHDDQHGTAIIALAALINAAEITGRKFSEMKIIGLQYYFVFFLVILNFIISCKGGIIQ